MVLYVDTITKIFRHLTFTHIEARVCGKELSHGAESHFVGMISVQGQGRVAHHGPGGHELGGHLGQLELVVLEGGQRLPELMTDSQMVAGRFQTGLRSAQRSGGWKTNAVFNVEKDTNLYKSVITDINSSAVETMHGNVEALTFGSNDVVHGHLTILENNGSRNGGKKLK